MKRLEVMFDKCYYFYDGIEKDIIADSRVYELVEWKTSEFEGCTIHILRLDWKESYEKEWDKAYNPKSGDEIYDYAIIENKRIEESMKYFSDEGNAEGKCQFFFGDCWIMFTNYM